MHTSGPPILAVGENAGPPQRIIEEGLRETTVERE
jgi:hypothetical protein